MPPNAMPPHAMPRPAMEDRCRHCYMLGLLHTACLAAFILCSYTDPDSLADALIEAGCREVERADVAAHGRL